MLLKRITEPAASPGGIALPADSANLRTESPVITGDCSRVIKTEVAALPRGLTNRPSGSADASAFSGVIS